MDKEKTYKRQKSSKKPIPFDPDKNLKKLSPKDILKALMFCIEHSDYEAFKEIVAAYLAVNNKAGIARRMGVSRRALYHMIGDNANPTIKNLMNFYQAIKKAA